MVIKTLKGFFTKLGKKVAHLFNVVIRKIRNNKLKTLVLMQLKDKWNFSFKANKKASIFKIITYIVIFGAIVGASYLLMHILVKKLNIFVSPFFPITAINFVIFVMTIFDGLAILVGLTRSLYFSKDNSVLITYPVKADYLFLSKLIVYIFDAIKNAFTIFVPVLFAYGLINGNPLGFYFWMPLCVTIYMIVLVSICGLLSIPTYFIMRFLKRFKVIKIVLALGVLAGLIVGSVYLIRLLPENINIIRTFEKFYTNLNIFLNNFKNKLSGIYDVTVLMCGEPKGYLYNLFSPATGKVLIIFVGLFVLFSIINLTLSKWFYNKMISVRPNQERIRSRVGSNKKASKFLSSAKYEFLRIIRSEKIIVTSLMCIVITPIFMMFINKIYCALSTRLFGDTMIIYFNILIMLLLTFSHNVSVSYIYSKDGPSWNTNKTMPYDPRTFLFSRLIYNSVVSVFIFVPAVIILFNTGKVSVSESVIIAFICFILMLVHILFSANFDYMHSKEKTIASIGSEYISKHETMSVAFAFIIAFGSAGLGLLMAYTSTSNTYLRLLIIALAVLALEIFIFLKKISATYQEN